MSEKQIDAVRRFAEGFRAESLARVDRVIAALTEMPDGAATERIGRVMQAIALWDQATDACSRSGRRRSRKERLADALCTELLGRWRALRDAFDELDLDMYLTLHWNAEAQGPLLAIVTTVKA